MAHYMARLGDRPDAGWLYDTIIDHNRPSFNCGACGREKVRYEHRLVHPNGDTISVGNICAGNLVGDTSVPKDQEKIASAAARVAKIAVEVVESNRYSFWGPRFVLKNRLHHTMPLSKTTKIIARENGSGTWSGWLWTVEDGPTHLREAYPTQEELAQAIILKLICAPRGIIPAHIPKAGGTKN